MGAMVISFLLTAILTIPPVIALKVMNVAPTVLLVYPFVQLVFTGSFLIVYSRVVWLHIEYAMTSRLDGVNQSPGAPRPRDR